ncbi:unnamed protein product [Ceratitis capitata]|uniref:(Mediterranean fruit fly) hypothetical protein n=4 Tax=Ceratitis capitata TaxID=7213 RepID=A0A811U8T9_CERCA|nr:unnamed protein product [Ceratitis capitata]
MPIYYLLLLLGVYPSGFLRDVDAANCSQTNDVWKCDSGACIKIDQLCDGTKHCRDGSDEKKKSCKDMKCSSLSFRCKYGACISVLQVCDGVPDCTDSSDEDINYCRQRRDNLPDYEVDDETSRMNCVGWGQMKCWSGQCVNIKDKCNGIRDCADGSDETEVLCGAIPCQIEEFRCGYGACIPLTAKCNGTIECLDGTDELENLCKEDGATEAAKTVTATTISAMTTITAYENDISNVTDTSSTDLIIPLENNNDEKYVSEFSTKVMDTTPTQEGKNNHYNNKNINSDNAGVIQDNTDVKTNPKYDHNEVTTHTNVDHITREPGIAVAIPQHLDTTTESAFSRPSLIDYSTLQNERSTTQSTLRTTDIKPIRPVLKMNLTQPGLDAAIESPLPSKNVQPRPVSKLALSNTTAKPSRSTSDFIIKTSLLAENTTSDEHLIKPLIKPTNARDEVPTNTPSRPTEKINKTIVQDNKAYNHPNIYKSQGPLTDTFLYSTSQMPPTFNQAHSALRTQVASTTSKIQTIDVVKSVCTLRGCEYPLVCALAMPPGVNPGSAINKQGRTALEVGSEVKFSCADGHYLDGADRKICTAAGWSHDTPSCTPYCEVDFLVACRYPLTCYYKQPRNDTVIKINYSFYGEFVKEYSSITFSCGEDYQLEGANSRECKMNGWQGNIPRCVNYCRVKGFHNCEAPLKCKILDSNTGILRDYSPHFVNHWLYKIREESVVEFSCESGYELIGMNRSTCGTYGWDNAEPSCKKVTCKADLIPKCENPLKCTLHHSSLNSDQQITNRSRPKYQMYPEGSEVTFSCSNGYKLQGENRTICGTNGWSHEKRMSLPKCSSLCANEIFEECKHPYICNYHNTKRWIRNIQKTYMESIVPVGSVIDFINTNFYKEQGFTRFQCTVNGWVHVPAYG